MTQGTRTGLVSFIGAGPGAADLMTLRGARRIAEADIVLWTPSLVSPECVREHVRGDAELIDTTGSSSQEVLEVCRRAERERLRVARVYSGDAVLWSAVQQQYDACSRMELSVEVVPGVAGYSAAAASVGRELTGPAEEHPVLLGKPDGSWEGLPETGKVREFVEHGTTMALSVSASRTEQLVERLRAGGYAEEVPVVVAYKVTCPDELVLRTNLGEVADLVKRHRLWRHTLFLVGRALQPTGTRSRSYGSTGSRRASGNGTDSAASTVSRRDGYGRRSPRGGESRATSSAEFRRRPSGSGSEDELPLARSRGDGQRGGSRAEADVAWWAVREWQRNARDSLGTDTRGAPGRRAEQETHPPDLFDTAQDPEVFEGVRTERAPQEDDVRAGPEETTDDTVERGSPVQVSSVDERARTEQNAEETSVEAAAEQDLADGHTGAEPAATEEPSPDATSDSADPSDSDSTAGPDTSPSEQGETGDSPGGQQPSAEQQSAKTQTKTGTSKSAGKSSGTKTGGRGKTQRKTTGSSSA